MKAADFLHEAREIGEDNIFKAAGTLIACLFEMTVYVVSLFH